MVRRAPRATAREAASSCEEDDRGGGEEGPDQSRVLDGDCGAVRSQGEQKTQCAGVGEDNGDSADSRDGLEVELTVIVWMVDDVEA